VRGLSLATLMAVTAWAGNKPHRTTKILSDARRRGGVAARGARAAGGDADGSVGRMNVLVSVHCIRAYPRGGCEDVQR
jgi:hypothetical protein